MRRVSRVLFRLLSYRPPNVPVPPQGIILTDVNVVNPGEKPRLNQTLVVDGGQIARIEPAGPGDSSGRYAGCYVLPGLADMHVHIPPLTRELANLLFLAHGVTTVREVGDADGSTFEARERIQYGLVPGPRLFAAGPVLDGAPPFLPTSWSVRSAAEAEDAVATLAAQGADFIKVHHKLSPAALTGVREAAARHGLRVVGHIPVAVPFAEARIWDVQHLDGVVPYPQAGESPRDFQERWARLEPARIELYARISQEQGLVHTPTLVSGESLLWVATGGPPASMPRQWLPVQRLPRYYREVLWAQMADMPMFRYMRDGLPNLLRQSLQRTLEVVRALHGAGVRLHLGTDTAGMPYVVPGASLHRELELFVQAGLDRVDAWVAGTRAAGESLGVSKLGVIAEEAPADLIVFQENPVHDLEALSTLRAVVAQGRFYSREALDEALQQHRECFERPAYDRVTTAVLRWMMRMMAGRGGGRGERQNY
jgi:cytosine/adenosine deaminase-related metal-dependent hydrolase